MRDYIALTVFKRNNAAKYVVEADFLNIFGYYFCFRVCGARNIQTISFEAALGDECSGVSFFQERYSKIDRKVMRMIIGWMCSSYSIQLMANTIIPTNPPIVAHFQADIYQILRSSTHL